MRSSRGSSIRTARAPRARTRASGGALGAFAFALAVGCGTDGDGGSPAPLPSPTEARPGGDLTVFDTSNDAFGQPAPTLTAERSDAFFVGNSFFKTNWVTAPSSTTGRDGLGPLFNARSCSSCHLLDGRGAPPTDPDEAAVALLLRLGVPAADGEGIEPHPVYGSQLQGEAILGVPAEGRLLVAWVEQPVTLGDGTVVTLRRPERRVADPAYGPLGPSTQTSARVAPAVFGLGLLAAIPEQALLAAVDEDDRDADGVSGRASRVTDRTTGDPAALGRFGWKAGQPTIGQQSAGAFANDIGLTSATFPDELCTAAQPDCAAAPTGGAPELGAEVLEPLDFYMHTLAVPARRAPDDPVVRRGRALFDELGCASCHRTAYRTAALPGLPELADQTIHPFTDLLLHDMGPALADDLPEADASGAEWRTPPLWGLGLVRAVSGHTLLLHDGRARGPLEAVLWHGGEAEGAARRVRELPAADRDALIAFLEDL